MGTLRIYGQGGAKLLASEGRAALSFWARLRGLLAHPPLQPGQGVWIAPCNWIHTLGMRFAIDVLYLDQERQILHLVSDMQPNRIGAPVWRAHSVVELPAGTIKRTGTGVGEQVEIAWDHQGE